MTRNRHPRIEAVAGEEPAPSDQLGEPVWRHYEFFGHGPPDHVAFIIRKRLAYVNWDTEQWDLIGDAKIAIPDHPHVCA